MVEREGPAIGEHFLPEHLSNAIAGYAASYQQRVNFSEDRDGRVEYAKSTISEAVFRNNRMSEILTSEEFGEVDKKTKELLGSCKIGVICCMDGRMAIAQIFGTSADVSKQMAAVLPTAHSADTNNLTIDSSTVKIAVINAPLKPDHDLLQVFVIHASSEQEASANTPHKLSSNCAAAENIREEAIKADQDVDPDLININLSSLTPGVNAIERTYNSSAKLNGKPELGKVAIRIIYDTDSMGFFLGYGETETLSTSELTLRYSDAIRQLSEENAIFQHPGALRYVFTNLEKFVDNEKLYLAIIEHLLLNNDFVNEVNSFCDNNTGSEICGLNDSQKQGLRYLIARNIALQYLTGVHLEQFSQKRPFASHAEEFMSVSLDDGHGMTVGGMDPEDQVFSAVASRIQNAVDHIKTMYTLMEKHGSKKPRILFVSRGIEDSVMTIEGNLDSVSADLDRFYKEIQKDEAIEELVRNGDLLMVPVIQSSRTGEIIQVLTTPLV